LRIKKAARRGRLSRTHSENAGLLDLRFLEIDMLARNRIIFAHCHLLGHCPGILLGNVEEAGIGSGNQLDLDGNGLGHGGALDVQARRALEKMVKPLALAPADLLWT
jgi:hypothetical protein